MPVLHEVTGASERPFGCPIRLTEDGDTVEIIIPARGAHAMVILASGMLIAYLLIVIVLGTLVFAFNVSVLGSDTKGDVGLPTQMQPYKAVLIVGWLVSEYFGFWSLATIARHVFVNEKLTIDPTGIMHQQRFFGKVKTFYALREQIQGFHLQRDPQGFQASILTLRARGERVQIAEYIREPDREWLASVGNALLMRM